MRVLRGQEQQQAPAGPARQVLGGLRRRGKGPVYFNAYLTNFTTEDFITRAGLEVSPRDFLLFAALSGLVTLEGSSTLMSFDPASGAKRASISLSGDVRGVAVNADSTQAVDHHPPALGEDGTESPGVVHRLAEPLLAQAGAHQTIDQTRLFGAYAPYFVVANLNGVAAVYGSDDAARAHARDEGYAFLGPVELSCEPLGIMVERFDHLAGDRLQKRRLPRTGRARGRFARRAA